MVPDDYPLVPKLNELSFDDAFNATGFRSCRRPKHSHADAKFLSELSIGRPTRKTCGALPVPLTPGFHPISCGKRRSVVIGPDARFLSILRRGQRLSPKRSGTSLPYAAVTDRTSVRCEKIASAAHAEMVLLLSHQQVPARHTAAIIVLEYSESFPIMKMT